MGFNAGAHFSAVSFFTPVPAIPVSGANNGVSLSGANVVLGNDVGAVGDPAQLLSNREIEMNALSISFLEGFLNFDRTTAGTVLEMDAIQAAFPQGDFFISKNEVAGNEIVNMGFNLSPNSTQIVAGIAAFGFSIEGSYQPNPGDYIQEMHLVQIKPAGTQVRILSVTADALTNNIDAFFSCSSFEWKSSDGSGGVWANFTGGGSAAVTFRLVGVGGTEVQMAYTEVAGTSTFGISTTAPGATELHMETWSTALLPGLVSSLSINTVSVQLLPLTDNAIVLGNQVNRFSIVNGVLGRISNGLLIGDYSANQTPSASLDITNVSNGTIFSAPLKLPGSGTLLVTPENGAIETNGTSIFFTAGGTRRTIFTGNDAAAAPAATAGVVITNFYGTAATNFLGDPNSWAAVVIAGTTYKIPLYT